MALTNNDVQIIMGMIARGDKQHDIAAWFGENQARIVEAEKGSHGHQVAASEERLPPKGSPGPKGRRLHIKVGQAISKIEAGEHSAALEILEEAFAKYASHQD
jgi:hypothetical protein